MTFTKQDCCAPIKKTTELSSLQDKKSCIIEIEEVVDDMNALCDSLSALDATLHKLSYLAEKKLAERNERKNAGS